MNIAMFTETFVPHANGVTTSILNSRRGLASRGHKVTVYSAGQPVLQNEGVHYYGGKVFPLYPDFPIAIYPTKEARANKRVLKEQGADLIHIHAPGPMGLRGYRHARKQKIPFLLTYHTVYEPLVRYAPFGWKTIYRVGSRAVDHTLSKHCRVLIAPTHQAKRDLVVKNSAWEDKIRIVPTGIDMNRFRPGLDATELRTALGFTHGERIILYLGRLSFEKNVNVLVKAFGRLHQRETDLRLVLAGTGPATEHLKGLAKSLGLNGSIRFSGHVRDEDVPLYYNAADVFASASDFETQGLTLLEAMATGCPAAVAGAGGFLDLVRDGKNGYLFPAGSVDGAVHALELALHAPASLRRAARETALKYSLETCAGLLEGAYEEALNAGAHPD